MKYEIKYSPSYSMLEVSLEPKEIIVAEAGAMIYMSPQITVKTRKRESDSLWRSIKTTVLGGESFFVNEYIAERGPGKVGFAPAPVGDINVLKVEAGRGLILQKSAYLASTEGITLDTEWQGFKRGLFGQSLFMLKVSGEGLLFVNAFGAIDRHSLKSGESLIVDNYHLVAFDDTCRYDVKKFGGLKSTILGGEGLVTEVYGPGEVYIQTKNIREFVDWLWELLHARVETTARTTAMEKREREGIGFSLGRPK
ncbi:MAG: TIGR00266 family protein [Candidatus Bathyarchaeia archaeon]